MSKKIQHSVGVFISNTKIVAIEIEKNVDKFKVSNHSMVPLEEGIVEVDSIIVDPEKFKEAFKNLLEKAKNGPIKAKEVIIGLHESNTFSHLITIPKEHEEDVIYIREKAKDLIPIELDQTVFDYKKISENEVDQTVKIKFIATQNNIVDSMIKVFDSLKIRIKRIDVDLSCLVKSYSDPTSETRKPALVIYSERKHDFLTIADQKNKQFHVVLKKNYEQLLKDVKTSLSLPSLDEAKKLLENLPKEDLSAKKEALVKGIQGYLAHFEERLSNLLHVARASDRSLVIEEIYLMGPFGNLPGITEIIKKHLPDTEIKTSHPLIETPDDLEKPSLMGLGLCINKMSDAEGMDFNLLPESKKNEITIAPIIPKVRRGAFLLMVLVIAPFVQLAVNTTRNYIAQHVRSQELIILEEQSSNPYLTEIAKIKQEEDQFKQTIDAMLSDSVPVQGIAAVLDSYNEPGLGILNVSYQNDPKAHMSQIRLSAEVANREKTEAFVSQLEQTGLFEEVISPLSNLIGKESRVVRIDLILDNQEAINFFETLNQPPINNDESEES